MSQPAPSKVLNGGNAPEGGAGRPLVGLIGEEELVEFTKLRSRAARSGSELLADIGEGLARGEIRIYIARAK